MPDGFEQFWAIYPRKIHKLIACRAYIDARKLATAEDIIAGVKRSKVYWANRERKYIPHPATWLRAGGWMDEYEEPIVQKPDIYGHFPPCRTVTECIKKMFGKGEGV